MGDYRRDAFLQKHIASLKRLQAAGLVEGFGFGPGPDDAWVRFDPAVVRLMRAGRSPMTDPELWALLARGATPVEIRAWLEAAVARLGNGDQQDGQAGE